MEPKRQIDGVYSSRPKPTSTGTVPPPRGPWPEAKRRASRKKPIFALGVALVIVGLVLGLHAVFGGHTSLVPKNIQKSVDFSVYYPDPQKMPASYNLDTKSFKLAQPGVVLFAVTRGTGNNIVFSEEQPPSSNDLGKFISTYIPLNTTQQFALGQAKIGAYGTAPNIRTVVSLPIHDGPWLIVTAPESVSHDDLVKILQALTK